MYTIKQESFKPDEEDEVSQVEKKNEFGGTYSKMVSNLQLHADCSSTLQTKYFLPLNGCFLVYIKVLKSLR